MSTRRSKKQILTGEKFDSLSPSQKERVYQEFERLTPVRIKTEFRALGDRERARHMRPAKPGRPRVGKGVKVISLSVEKELLQEADSFAKERGMKRTELVAAGLKLAMSHL